MVKAAASHTKSIERARVRSPVQQRESGFQFVRKYEYQLVAGIKDRALDSLRTKLTDYMARKQMCVTLTLFLASERKIVSSKTRRRFSAAACIIHNSSARGSKSPTTNRPPRNKYLTTNN